MSELQGKHALAKDRASRSLTRRTFLGFAGVGAAALVIDQVSGGALIATAKELAARAVGTSNTATIQFVTIDYNEIALTVRDAKDSRKFVEGARVRIKTLATGRGGAMAEATTNSQGVALINVAKLAENPENERYDFYGQVFVTKEGYRDFEIGAMRFYGGQATGVYFQEDDGKPYLRCLTFDDYDIQYTEQVMVSTVANTRDHTLKATVVSAKPDQEVEINYWTGEPRTSTYFNEVLSSLAGTTQAVDASAGTFYEGANGRYAATKTFVHPFLNPAETDWFFGIDKPLHLHVWVNRTDRFRVDAKLSIMQGIIDEPDRGTGDEKADTWTARCNSEEDYYDGLNVDLPDGLPGMNKFNMWMPSFPGTVLFTPSGEFAISHSVTIGCYKEKGGKTEEDKAEEARKAGNNPPKEADWQDTPSYDVAKQLEKKYDDMKNAMDLFCEAKNRAKVPGAYGPLSRCGGEHQSTKTFTVSLGAFINGKHDDDKKLWNGDFGLFGKFAFSFNWSHMVLVMGYVPLNFILDITASAMLKIQGECTFEDDELAGKPRPKASEGIITGGRIVLPFKFYIAVTVSVGINGVCSVGLRGSAYLYITLSLGTGGAEAAYEFGADVTVVLELLLFHYEWTFASFESKGSTKQRSNLMNAAEAQSTVALASPAELDDIFQPFTEEGMLSTSEFALVPNVEARTMSLLADNEDAPDPLEVAYTYSYSPYEEGAGVQSGEEPMLMTLSDEGTFTPQVERCVLSGAFSNARLQLMLNSEQVVRGVFRLATARVFNPAATPSYQNRTRMCVAGINQESGVISFESPTVPGNFWAPHNYPEMNRWDLDYTSMSLAPYASGWAWVAATVYAENRPASFSAAMMDSRIAIQFARFDTTSYYQELIIDPKDHVRGSAKYAYAYNMSFTEMPDDSHGYPTIGFACAIVGFDSAEDTEPAVQFIYTAAFSLKDGTWELSGATSHKVRISGNYRCGMLAIDSIVAFPPNTEAHGYHDYNHNFNVAYTVQTISSSASARKRRFLFFTNHPDSLSADMFGGKDYSFTGNLTRLDRDFEGTPVHVVVARFTGDMLGVDPDDSPVGKLLAFNVVDYARRLTRDPMECGMFTVEADIGPENKDVDYGGFQMSRDGNLLFFTKTFDGNVPEGPANEGTESSVTSNDSPEERHQICAARYINGHFTDPFPLVDLKHSPDSFQYIPYANGWGGNDDAYVFLYSHITDTSAGKADTYMVRMPYLKRLTLIDIAPVEPAIPLGASLQLEITSRNDGNVILGGFTVRFTDEKNKFTRDVKCDCSYKSYVPNVYDGVNSTLDEVEPDTTAKSSIFFPGYTNTYTMTVELPDDYPAGNHELQAVILEDSYIATTAETYAEWGEDEQVVACALSYADPEPLVFSMANGAEVDVTANAPAEGEEAAHASDYVSE